MSDTLQRTLRTLLQVTVSAILNSAVIVLSDVDAGGWLGITLPAVASLLAYAQNSWETRHDRPLLIGK